MQTRPIKNLLVAQLATKEVTFVCWELKSAIAFYLLHLKVVVCSAFVCSCHGNHNTKAPKTNINLFVMMRSWFLPILVEID